jgi:type IV pilus assembly protein PilB
VDAGLLNEDHLKAALNEQRKWGGRLGRTVVEMGFVKEADMVHVLAQQLDLRTVDLDQARLPEKITDCLRLDLAERYGVFPLGIDAHGHVLFVATSDPTNVDHVQELEFATNMKLELAVATGSSIDRAIRKYYFGENVVATPTLRPEGLGVHETTFELDALLGEAPSTPASHPAPRASVPPPTAAPEPRPSLPASPPSPEKPPAPPSMDVDALKREVAVLREQVMALETISSSQVRALRVLLEILIESGLVTRDEYLEHLHRPE